MTEVQSPSGVLLIDKPRGITSHDVVSRLRRAFNMQRIGHAGTLDPDATGLLILCLGKATKLSMTLSEKDKTYRVGFLLGKETDTYDSVGQVLAERPVNATREAVESVLQGFVGTQVQRPPIYSAVKVKGRKLYEYARAGKPVEIPTRHVTIHSIQLLRLEGAEGEIEVACSKGTYVRTLIHDVGRRLETGAITTSIRRLMSGTFSLEEARTLDYFTETSEPMERLRSALISIPAVLMAQTPTSSSASSNKPASPNL